MYDCSSQREIQSRNIGSIWGLVQEDWFCCWTQTGSYVFPKSQKKPIKSQDEEEEDMQREGKGEKCSLYQKKQQNRESDSKGR